MRYSRDKVKNALLIVVLALMTFGAVTGIIVANLAVLKWAVGC